jgi:hypothetical protein
VPATQTPRKTPKSTVQKKTTVADPVVSAPPLVIANPPVLASLDERKPEAVKSKTDSKKIPEVEESNNRMTEDAKTKESPKKKRRKSKKKSPEEGQAEM